MPAKPESPSNHETATQFEVDPWQLVENSPASLIYNPTVYNDIRYHFDWRQWQNPHVCDVLVGKDIQLLVRDGMNRTLATAHRQEAGYEEFKTIKVTRITQSLLENPRIVGEEYANNPDGRDYLKMGEYLRAIVMPTVQQGKIAPSRIAAHLTNGWQNMVGPEISGQFTAFSAFSFLDESMISPGYKLDKRFWDKQKPIMADETPEQRQILISSLQNMAEIIQSAELTFRQVALKAFTLVAEDSPVLQKEARELILGLLHMGLMQEKLSQSYKSKGKQAQVRSDMGEQMWSRLSLLDEPDRSKALSLYRQLINDEEISVPNIITIIQSDQPQEDYNNLKIEISIQWLTDSYLEKFNIEADELSSYEQYYLKQFGQQSIHPSRLEYTIEKISQASKTLKKAHLFSNNLQENRDSFIEGGVDPATISNTLTRITFASKDLLEGASPTQLRNRITKLSRLLIEQTKKIHYQLGVQHLKESVDTIWSDKQPDFIMSAVLSYFTTSPDFNDLWEERDKIHSLLQNIRSLDPDLQRDVLNRKTKFAHAKALQLNRLTEEAQVEQTAKKPKATQVPRPKPGGVRLKPTPAQEPDTFDDLVERMDEKDIRDLTLEFKNLLYDLEKEGVTRISEKNLNRLNSVFNLLGKLLYDHPNSARIIKNYLADQETRSSTIRSTI